jgi:hypothetical protein
MTRADRLAWHGCRENRAIVLRICRLSVYHEIMMVAFVVAAPPPEDIMRKKLHFSKFFSCFLFFLVF